MLETDGLRLVFDVGPDFRQQMLRAGGQRVDAILLTHEHNDHVAGLDDVRPFNFRYQMDMPLFGLPRTLAAIRERFPYVFDKNPYPGAPVVRACPIDPATDFCIENLLVRPIEVLHGQMPILGFRIKDLTYITDAKSIPEGEIEKINGTKVLVVNALRSDEHHSHFSLPQALAFIESVSPERAYLLHFSHQLGPHAALQGSLPKGVFAAYDGLEVLI